MQLISCSLSNRNCKMIGVNYFDESKEKNMYNYSAAYLIKRNVIDMQAWHIALSADEQNGQLLGYYRDFVEMTKSVGTLKYQLGQFIKNPNTDKTDFSEFLYDNLNLLVIILIGYLLIILSAIVILKVLNRNYKLLTSFKLAFLKIFYFNQNLAFRFAFMLMCLDLFLWLNLEFLSATIKTDSILVDQSEIIDSVNQFVDSNKVLVIIYNEEYLLAEAQKNSFLKKLHNKKVKQSKLYIFAQDINADILNKFIGAGLDKYFFFLNDNLLIHTLSALTDYSNELISFVKPTSFYEIVSAFPLRKNLESYKKSYIHKIIDRAFENGQVSYMVDKLKLISLKTLKKSIKVFENLEDFVDEFTSASNVEFDNYKRIFISYISILIAIFVAFISHHLYKFLKINRIRNFRILIFRFRYLRCFRNCHLI